MKQRFFCAVFAIMLVFSLAVGASAAVIDKTTKGSITLTMKNTEGKTVGGGTMSLYYVAAIEENNGTYSFAYTDAFKGCSVDLNGDLTSAATAKAIELYTVANSKTVVPTHRKNIASNGVVKFDNLNVGLYLLVQHHAAAGYSTMASFLISVPREVNGVYDYSVDAAPKMGPIRPEGSTETTETTATTVPKDGTAPQTGQLNWPVPVLAVSGLLCFLLGWYLNRTGKNKQYEI